MLLGFNGYGFSWIDILTYRGICISPVCAQGWAVWPYVVWQKIGEFLEGKVGNLLLCCAMVYLLLRIAPGIPEVFDFRLVATACCISYNIFKYIR